MHTEPGKTSSTVKVAKLFHLGRRSLTRAHLALARRPRVSAQARAAFERICTALGAQLGVEVTGHVAVVEATWRPQRGLGRGAGFALVSLTGLGAPSVLELDLPFLTSVVGRLAGARNPGAPVDSLTRIEEAAFGYLGLVALSAFREQPELEQVFRPRLEGTTTDKTEAVDYLEDAPHVCFEARLCVGGEVGIVRFALASSALRTALHAFADELPAVRSPEVDVARLTLRTFAGRSQLDAQEVASLVAGDVVLLDGIRLSGGALFGATRLSSRGFDLWGELSPDGFIHAQSTLRALPQENAMTTHVPGTPALPVDVEIELTRIQLSLGELACLTPGAVLQLRMSASDPVLVRVGDRAVARAELVEIEGEVGARIIALLP